MYCRLKKLLIGCSPPCIDRLEHAHFYILNYSCRRACASVKGALAIGLVDSSTGYVIWASVATADIQNKSSNNLVRTRLNYAVGKILEPISQEPTSDY